jgi:hypothetical protein
MNVSNSMQIEGFNNTAINILLEHEGKNKLAVLFPGLGYTLDAPIFYYTRQLLKYLDYTVLGVDYRYKSHPDFEALSPLEKHKWFEYDMLQVSKALEKETSKYPELCFMGKSLGTVFLLNYVQQHELAKNTALIWITPSIVTENIFQYLETSTYRSLLIVAGKDPHCDPAFINRVKQNATISSHLIENCGHSFEEPGHLEQSIVNMKEVMVRIETFLSKH